MKSLLFTFGMLALSAGCSQSGDDASSRGFNATLGATSCASDADCKAGSECDFETEQGLSVGQCKPHGGAAPGSGLPCATNADCATGLECETESEHGAITATCQAHGGKK